MKRPLCRGAPDRSILALDDALTAFSRLAPRQAKVVELRYFGGLTEEEIVAALNISPRTVRRDWDLAKGLAVAGVKPLESVRSELERMTPERFQQIEELYHAAREANRRGARGAAGPDRSRIAPRSRVAARAAGPAANSWIGLPFRTRRNCWRIRRVTVIDRGRLPGAIPYRRQARRGRHGRGLSGDRHAIRPRRRHQDHSASSSAPVSSARRARFRH